MISKQKVAAFLPFNSAGHFQGPLTIANQLRNDHNVRCVFIIAGPPHSRSIEDHGHQLIELEDRAEPLWDFEIEPGEDLSKPMSEEEEQRRLSQGKKKVPFVGAARWPQFMARNQYYFRGQPKLNHLAFAKLLQQSASVFIDNYEYIDRALESIRPDIIINDIITPPFILSNEQSLPWLQIWSPNPLSVVRSKLPGNITPLHYLGLKFYTKEERARMQREQPELWQSVLSGWARESAEAKRICSEFKNKMQKYYSDLGLGERLARGDDPVIGRVDSPHLNIYMFPAALDYDQDDDLFEYPARWLRCDSLIRSQAGKNEAQEHANWLAQIEAKMRHQKLTSIVYFSLGSIASGEPTLMQRYIDHLSSDQSNRLYIISKGVNGDEVQLCDRNMLGGNYLPQTFLLQRADLAIIHGGNNSLTESLYYGKPVIVLPAFADQLDNGQRVEDLGLGKRLDLHKCTRDELLQAIDELANDDKLRARAHSIGVAMRTRNDLAKVSTIISDMIDKRQLTSETAEKYGIKL